MTLYSYQIVSGWDDAVSMVNLETISVTGAPLLKVWNNAYPASHYVVRSIGNYRRNESANLEGGVTQQGYATIRWFFEILSAKAFDYFLTTYAQDSSNQGKCTIATRVRKTVDYANYNAIVRLEFNDEEMVYRSGYFWILNPIATITLKEAL